MPFLRILLYSLMICRGASAEVKYVSDVLYIPLKSEANNNSKTIQHLKSGTSLVVTDQSSGSDFIKVKIGKGENERQGYVKTRYLTDEPIAKFKLAQLKATVSSLEGRQMPLKSSVKDLKMKLAQVKSDKENLQKELERLSGKMKTLEQVSSGKLDLFKKNKDLQEQNIKLKENYEVLKKDHGVVTLNQRNEGIRLGLFAIGLGGLAGFLLPYLKPRGRGQRSVRLR